MAQRGMKRKVKNVLFHKKKKGSMSVHLLIYTFFQCCRWLLFISLCEHSLFIVSKDVAERAQPEKCLSVHQCIHVFDQIKMPLTILWENNILLRLSV